MRLRWAILLACGASHQTPKLKTRTNRHYIHWGRKGNFSSSCRSDKGLRLKL